MNKKYLSEIEEKQFEFLEDEYNKILYELSHDKNGLNKYFNNGNYYHIHSDELTKEEIRIHRNLLNHSARENLVSYFRMGDDDKNDIKLNRLLKEAEVLDKKILDSQNETIKYYTWGFECPNIDNLKNKEQQDEVYNKILDQFEEQLKNWIYGNK